jgi:hypothetical protein
LRFEPEEEGHHAENRHACRVRAAGCGCHGAGAANTCESETCVPATDVTAADIQKFIDALPKDAISDNPIRIVDVGNAHIGVYGVFRPKNSPQDAILHDTTTSEIYYMLEGSATLVTGGTIAGKAWAAPARRGHAGRASTAVSAVTSAKATWSSSRRGRRTGGRISRATCAT